MVSMLELSWKFRNGRTRIYAYDCYTKQESKETQQQLKVCNLSSEVLDLAGSSLNGEEECL